MPVFKLKAYKIILKVRKFQLPTYYRFSTAEGEYGCGWIPPSPRLNRVKGALFADEANLTIDSHPLNRLYSWILGSSICQRFQSFILTLSNQALQKRNDLTKTSLVKLNFAILTAQAKQDPQV